MLKEKKDNLVKKSTKAETSAAERLLFVSVAATGLDAFKDRICKISVVDHKGKEFNYLINPEISVKDYAVKAHGFTDDQLKKAQKLEDIVEELVEIIEAHNVVVAYNFSFVFQILQNELYRVCGYRLLEESFTFVDPYLIFKKLYPYSLKNAVKTFLGQDYKLNDSSAFSAKVLKDIFHAQEKNNPEFFEQGLRKLEHFTIGDIGVPGRWFSLKDDNFVFAIGKFKGKKVTEEHVDYLNWLSSLEDITVSERKFIEDFSMNAS
ncbi:MAG: 3'-5' exonuclease [Candidatus Caenarcaniphilales bacterium]|nr:3'-5' exonuclease [Candidatus Caenarcaniphilales bacterium]